MKTEKYQNYYNALQFLFLVEGINKSILTPIAPFIINTEPILKMSTIFGIQNEN